jgi:carbon monoxide dehydrogenase subunit G
MRAVERVRTSATPDVVWRVLADVEHWRDWTPTVIEIKPLNGTELTVGARYRVLQPKLHAAVYEIKEYVPNQRFMWAQRFPGGEMIADHRIADRDGATEVELSFESKGLVAYIVGILFSKMIRDYVATEARSLKEWCDSLASQRS